MLKRLFSHSVLTRYIVSYFFIVILIFSGVSIYVNYNFEKTAWDSVTENNINRLSMLRTQHEEKLRTLSDICNQISFSSEIAPFKFSESPLDAYYIKQQLASFRSADNFFSQIYLTFHMDDYLYSNATSVPLQIFTDKFVLYDTLSADQLRSYLKGKNSSPIILPSQKVHTISGDTSAVGYIIPLKLNGLYNVGNIFFLVNDSTYQKMFSDKIDENRNMYILNESEILVSGCSLDIPDDTIYSIVKDSVSTGSNLREFTYDGKKFILFIEPGTTFDLFYASLIPYDSISQLTTHSQLTFGLFLVLLGLPCSILIVCFALNHIRPIRDIQKIFNKITAPADFSVIQNGIKSLIYQNMELHTQLDSTLDIQRADFVKDFIKGRFSSREDAISAAQQSALNIDYSYYAVCVVSTSSVQKLDIKRLEDLINPVENITICISESISEEQYILLLFFDYKEKFDFKLKRIQQELVGFYPDITISVSNIHEDFSQASTAYMEAIIAYDNRFTTADKRILCFTDVNLSTKDIDLISRRFLDDFKSVVFSSRNSLVLNDWINELFSTLSSKNFSLFAFRIVVNNITCVLLDKYCDHKNTSMDIFKYYNVFTFSQCHNIEELKKILYGFCLDIIQNSLPAEEFNDMKLVTEFLQKHYADPNLTVGSVAENFNMSSTKLSLEYKKQIGLYPSAMLLSLRMEEAKKLLLNTEMTVKEIGTTVGYYDSSSFIRRFRQYTSITPSQYRKNSTQTKNGNNVNQDNSTINIIDSTEEIEGINAGYHSNMVSIKR